MPEQKTSTYMIRMPLHPDRLFEFGRRRGLPLRYGETGYLLHCHLKELFGELAPKPFRVIETRGRQLVILGYCAQDPERLREFADTYADPQVHAACRWEGFAGKAMPETWKPGAAFGFELRVCPVVRMGSAGPKHRKGAEVDAFLATCWRMGEGVPVDRNHVYLDWVKGRFEARGAAKIIDSRVIGWKREKLVRRNHTEKRTASTVERPDVIIGGRLEVSDPNAFRNLLSDGVGRHKSFGFGMLMLRPHQVKQRC